MSHGISTHKGSKSPHYCPRTKRVQLFILFILSATSSMMAQNYKYKIGGGIGISHYVGDAANANALGLRSTNLFVEGKKIINLRWELGLSLGLTNFAGKTKKGKNIFPNSVEATFQQSLIIMGVRSEFNFMPFSDKYKYLQTSRISPYIISGINLHATLRSSHFQLSPGIEVGFGIKYRPISRMDIFGEYVYSNSLSDGLDATNQSNKILKNPYQLNKWGFKNKDAFGRLRIGICYEIGEIKPPCEKEKF